VDDLKDMFRRLVTGALPAVLASVSLFPVTYRFEHYSAAHGLTNQNVRAIAQDGAGLLWVGTTNGLFRFDGNRFQRYGTEHGLANPSIMALFLDSEGRLWAGTANGVGHFAEGRFQPLDGVDSDAQPSCIDGACMAELPDKRLVVTGGTGVFLVKNGRTERRLAVPGDRYRGVLPDGPNRLWITTNRRVLRVENALGDSPHTNSSHEEVGLPSDRDWTAPVRDSSGRIWLRSRGGLFVLDPNRSRFRRAAVAVSSSGRITRPVAGMSGQLWVPTNDGIWRRQETGGVESWILLSSRNGMPADAVQTVFWDRYDTPWIGTEAHGLLRWNGYPNWTSWRTSDGLSHDGIMSFASDSAGRIWVGSSEGLNLQRTDGSFQIFDRKHGLADNEVRALAATGDGAVWAGSGQGGLTRIGPDGAISRYGREDGLGDLMITTLRADAEGGIWVSTRAGLFRGNWRAPRVSFAPAETPFSNPARTIYKTHRSLDGSLWVASSVGLARQRDGRWSVWTRKDGLVTDGMVFFAEREPGEIWIGYTGVNGIARLRLNEDGKLLDLTHRGRKQGLLSDNISFLEAAEGELWVGSDEGVEVLDRGGGWRRLRGESGLIYPDIMLGGFYAHPDGRRFLGTNGGYSEVRPLPRTDTAHPAAIVDASSGGLAIPVGGGAETELPQPNLLVSFGDLRLMPNPIFRYRLRSNDSDEASPMWTNATQPSVEFASLRPGSYVLEVQAGGDADQWSPVPATLRFRVPPPLVQTWWFQTILIGTISLTAFLLWRRRLSRIELHNAELEQAVAERTRVLLEQAQSIENQKAEIEALLARANQSNELKNEFLANMSHEIRTPMNGVLGMTSLALATELTAEQREYLETAQSSAESLLRILNDILDFSKIEAGRLDIEVVPFSALRIIQDLGRTMAVYSRTRPVVLRINIGADFPGAWEGDPVRLRQILSNLLSNAFKFTGTGEVELRAELVGPNEARFTVIDSGIGIPPGKLELIFEPFRQADGTTTRRYGGTGLGLAICRRLVTMMGGRIWAENNPGAGSRFSFTVPVRRAGVRPRPARPAPPPATGAMRVLLVEDDPVSRLVASRLLQKRGHEVVEAFDGADAVAACTRSRFDLILMDVQMPETDGLTATRRIRELESSNGRRTPIVMLTANAMKGDQEESLAAGADGYLTKPLEIEKFDACLSSIRTGR